jgi:hypothetical protein
MTEYTFRTLNAKDIFPVCEIISKIGFNEFKGCLNGVDLSKFVAFDKEAIYQIGFGVMIDIAGVVLANMYKCESQIFTFMASITGLEVEQVEAMPLPDFAEMIADFTEKPELKDFMKVVSRFLK